MIPPITDPLGRYWKQPPLDAIAIDDTHAIMDQAAFKRLPEYSQSRPTGVYPGKMWKAITATGEAYLCWYGIVEGRDDLCSNNHRLILLCE